MSVTIRRKRDGSLRPFFYGEFTDSNGVRVALNLGKWRGTPPAKLLGTGDADTGDAAFERSREEAERKLAGFIEEAKHKGRTEHLMERLIEIKSGAAVEYVKLADIAAEWLPPSAKVSAGYRANCTAVFERFKRFMLERDPKTSFLYQVTAKDALEFCEAMRAENLSPKSYRESLRLLRQAFDRFLPAGSMNPFRSDTLKREFKANEGEEATFHRKPFTPEELKALLDAARADAYLYPLVTAAACTGLRRGDVCKLRWRDVDMDGRMLAVKTHKTGAEVEIPLFQPLYDVLAARVNNGSEYCFPEAEKMLRENPDGLTWRFKKIVATAFAPVGARTLPVTVPAQEIEAEGVAAIQKRLPANKRRDRILKAFRLYCAGSSMSAIAETTGDSKGTVSNYLHAVERLLGKSFTRVRSGDIKAAIKSATQIKRGQGQRAASVRDWHALRATWVTLALAAGVPVEVVRRVTGHATADVVLKFYFRPDREQFKAALLDAMPEVLTGRTDPKRLTTPPLQALPSPSPLAELAVRIEAGTATEAERTRFKKLAAKI